MRTRCEARTGGSPRRYDAIRGAGSDRTALSQPEGHDRMHTEKIQVRVTETRQLMEVVVYDKRASSIQVVLGSGVHSIKCELTPTRNGLAYAGSAMGREIVYERSREQVQADIDRLNPREFNRR
jgi:hypothetical protein